MTISRDLAAWDGKSAADIRDIYDRHCGEPSFVSEIIQFTKQPPLQNGATWLLKRHVENAGVLDAAAISEICQLLPNLAHWEARLHVLQCLPFLPVPDTHTKTVETFLRACLIDDAKFVRAWAYSGFYELAVQYPEYRQEAGQLLDNALAREPASVKARIRKVMKKGI